LPVRRILCGIVLTLGLTGIAYGQTAPATRPEVRVDLSTPLAALSSYFRAQQSMDLTAIEKTIITTQPGKLPYVGVVLNFRLWRHYLERQAIGKFGREAGLAVEGQQRSYDEQLALDLKRIGDAAVELSHAEGNHHQTAKVFLTVEPDRPVGLQTDRFDFLDVYYLTKTDDGWKVDFLKTTDSFDDDREPLLKFEAGVFPVMANALKDLSEKVQKGQIATADELKAALQEQWNKAYGGSPDSAPANNPARSPAGP
jgi:hypothetical protein